MNGRCSILIHAKWTRVKAIGRDLRLEVPVLCAGNDALHLRTLFNDRHVITREQLVYIPRTGQSIMHLINRSESEVSREVFS